MRGIWVLPLALSLAGCSGVSLKAGSSIVIDRLDVERRNNVATADVFLSRAYQGGEVNIGFRHLSNVDTPDAGNGVNGVFFELRTTLLDFSR